MRILIDYIKGFFVKEPKDLQSKVVDNKIDKDFIIFTKEEVHKLEPCHYIVTGLESGNTFARYSRGNFITIVRPGDIRTIPISDLPDNARFIPITSFPQNTIVTLTEFKLSLVEEGCVCCTI